MAVFPLFPTLVHSIEPRTFKQVRVEIIKEVYEEKRRDSKGRIVSNQGGGWQSEAFEFSEKKDSILRNFIGNEVTGYFMGQRIFDPDASLTFGNFWYNINGKGGYNLLHTHPGVKLSGVLWIKTPKDCGNIWFDSPHMHHAFEELRSYNGDFKKRTGSYHDYEFYAKEGVMLIFPSYVYHRVAPNESRQERISCSFNCNIQ